MAENSPFDIFLDAVITILPPEAKDIDRDLLTLAFLHGQNQEIISSEQLQHLLDVYGVTNYESLEFFGDGVLEVLLKHMIYQALPIQGPSVMSRVISILRSNNFISCLAGKHNLCRSNTTKGAIKFCADIFEALLGAVFLHLINQGRDAYRITYHWLATFWEIPKYIGLFLGRRNDPCFADSKITSPQVKLSQVNVPLSQLPVKVTSIDEIVMESQNLDPDDLSFLIEKLQEEYLEKTIYKNPEETLTTMFRQLGLRQPRYILNQPTGIVVPCPPEICPNGGLLGLSQNKDITIARQEAARQSIDSLRDMGLIDF